MIQRKRSKLFFPFGILSLSILPILGFQKIASVYKTRTAPQHCIELNFPGTEYDLWTHPGKKFSELRKYKSFTLTANSYHNAAILEHSRIALNKIKGNLDTLNGIHIIISDSTKYRDIIKAVDYSFEEFPAAFMSYKSDFWTMYIDVDTTNISKDILGKWKKKYKKIHCR